MATQSIDRPLSTSPEFGNGALTYGDKAIWVAIQGPGQDSGSSESYTHRKATEAAALLPLAPAPSSGDAALGDSEAFIMQRSESLRTAWGGRGWASASLTQHLQTPNTGSYTAGGGGAQTEPRFVGYTTVSSPPPSEELSPGLGSPGDCNQPPGFCHGCRPAAAGDNFRVDVGRAGHAGRTAARPEERRCARLPLVVRIGRDNTSGKGSPKPLLAEALLKGELSSESRVEHRGALQAVTLED